MMKARNFKNFLLRFDIPLIFKLSESGFTEFVDCRMGSSFSNSYLEKDDFESP